MAPYIVVIKASYEQLRDQGCTTGREFLTPKQLFEVGGLTENMKIDAAAGGMEYAGGVQGVNLLYYRF